MRDRQQRRGPRAALQQKEKRTGKIVITPHVPQETCSQSTRGMPQTASQQPPAAPLIPSALFPLGRGHGPPEGLVDRGQELHLVQYLRYPITHSICTNVRQRFAPKENRKAEQAEPQTDSQKG